MFGAVCRATGQTEALLTPFVNKAAMTQHLKQISEATVAGRRAVAIINGAGWHTMDTAEPCNNLTSIKLPPYFTRAKSNRTSLAMAQAVAHIQSKIWRL